MQISAKELAQIVDGKIEGDPEMMLYRPSKIEEGGAGTISFLGNDKYEEFVYTTTASALLVSNDFLLRRPIGATLIRVENVYASMAKLLKLFNPDDGRPEGISPNAFIHPEATIEERAAIGPFAVIEANAIVGQGTIIFSHAYIGRNVRLGKNVLIYPGARILHSCVVGDNCIIHPNAVIGSDGFGFARDKTGRYDKIPQTGNVVLESDVEIGAGAMIDRATMGSTLIRQGVKLDNLVQIGHNVEIGKNTAMAAQAGVAGSTKIGRDCLIGGQVGFVGHIEVADEVKIQAQSGIAASVKKSGQALFGSPAIAYRAYLRSYSLFRKLPELYKRIQELERRLANYEDQD